MVKCYFFILANINLLINLPFFFNKKIQKIRHLILENLSNDQLKNLPNCTNVHYLRLVKSFLTEGNVLVNIYYLIY